MDYQETTEYLFAKTANYELQGKSGYKPGLGNMLALDEHLETCHKGLYVIGDGSGVTHSLSHASASGVFVARQIASAV